MNESKSIEISQNINELIEKDLIPREWATIISNDIEVNELNN
jgi:hypothetical protein